MNTLLLRLSGPMQAWGVQSRFGVRDSGYEPSKSGVLGLVCAAMGIPRENDGALARLAGLRMGVRVDQEGVLKVDYHTAQKVLKAAGGIKDTELSNRYYLADAIFLVALEDTDADFLGRIHDAIRRPKWPLFLGRKAFVPSAPVWLEDGLKLGLGLVAALKQYPSIANQDTAGDRLRLVYEDPEGDYVRPDQPLSFSTRRFASRRVTITAIAPQSGPAQEVN